MTGLQIDDPSPRVPSVDDSGNHQTVITTYMGQTQTDVAQIIPYGLASYTPDDSEWILFSPCGWTNHKCGIGNNYVNRFKGVDGTGLKKGEVALFNQLTGNTIYFSAEGDTLSITTATSTRTVGINDIVSIGNSRKLTANNEVSTTAPLVTLAGNVDVKSGATGVLTTATGQIVTVTNGIVTNIN